MQKVVVFGSTGMTGVCAVEAAVQKGLNVRAFVRDPLRLPDHLRNSVEIVKGDVLNYTDVYNAIRNVTEVVVVLGTGNDLGATTVLSEGTRNIVKAMKELNIEVVSVCSSDFLLYEPDTVPLMFKELTEDHKRQFEIVKESGLKYIAVFPPFIADSPGVEYEIKHDDRPGKVITKSGLGKFLIDCLSQPEHYGKMCGICTKSQ